MFPFNKLIVADFSLINPNYLSCLDSLYELHLDLPLEIDYGDRTLTESMMTRKRIP